jgi:hypothetical protein
MPPDSPPSLHKWAGGMAAIILVTAFTSGPRYSVVQPAYASGGAFAQRESRG